MLLMGALDDLRKKIVSGGELEKKVVSPLKDGISRTKKITNKQDDLIDKISETKKKDKVEEKDQSSRKRRSIPDLGSGSGERLKG